MDAHLTSQSAPGTVGEGSSKKGYKTWSPTKIARLTERRGVDPRGSTISLEGGDSSGQESYYNETLTMEIGGNVSKNNGHFVVAAFEISGPGGRQRDSDGGTNAIPAISGGRENLSVGGGLIPAEGYF